MKNDRLQQLRFRAQNQHRFRRAWNQCAELTMVNRHKYIESLFVAAYYGRRGGFDDTSYIECGTWRGGMSFGMMQALPQIPTWHFFDSFEGLPPAREIDGEEAVTEQKAGRLKHDNNTADYDEFVRNAERFRNPNQRVEVHRGWFEDTLAGFEPERPISILRMDGDWYDSTMVVLERLYDHVQVGGLILIDDYYRWVGCSRAVHDFLSKRQSNDRLRAHGPVAFIQRGRHPS